MKGKFLNTKNVVIGLVSLVLIGASATGVTIFLKNRGQAEAAGEQVQNLPATGREEQDNNQTNTNPGTAEDPNNQGNNTEIPGTPVEPTTPNTNPGTTTPNQTTGGTTTNPSGNNTTTGIEETVRIERQKVFEDLQLSWTTIGIPAITANMGIFKPELQIEKTATAVIREGEAEQIPVMKENKPMVRAGDTIIYTIQVSNLGNYKATNVVVTDSLDVIFDGKTVPANEELAKIETLEAGKVATLKVGYVVKQEDIDAVLETEQNEIISKDIINIATATDGKTTVEDDDDMPVNPDVTINVNKNWQDNDNQDGKRPEKITVELYRNNENEPIKTVTIDASSDWKYVFSKLPKYDENKNEITYRVVEETVPEYDTEYEISDNGVEIYNHHTPEKVSVEGSKTWNDEENQDGKRPSSITVRLFADGTEVTSKEVTANDNWSWSFTDLDKYNSGTEIVYTISEDEVADYTTVVNGYDVTNTHTPEKTTITGSKTWDDADNQDGKRTESITVRLFADGTEVTSKTVTANDNWSWSFTGLDKYNSGTEIVYTISEDEVTDYITVVDGYNITNTHTPEKISISGSKTWDDASNQDGKRPDSITVRLLAGGKEVTSKTVTSEDGWKWSFTDLDKYNSGTEIVYTISEDTVADYTTVVDGYNITNTHTPEKTIISGSKTWNDNNNQDGKRPDSITVRLFADGTEVTSKEVTANDNWSWSFTGLDKYNSGTEIVYTISEDAVTDYTTEVKGYNVTNTHTPEKISITGSKTWDDEGNQDGKRPEKITVKLLANGRVIDHKEVTINNNWSWSFEHLPVYEKGTKITYTIREDTVKDYETRVDGYNITNTHKTETTTVSGSKTWNDKNNQDGVRPDSITVELLKTVNGTTTSMGDNYKRTLTGSTVDYSWSDLPVYEEGKEITYTVKEVGEENGKIAGKNGKKYKVEYDEMNITNSYEPEKTEVSGTKTWVDYDNKYNSRPESITINLLANGGTVASQTVTEAKGWSWSFKNLDKYKNGQKITYTISEEKVSGYTSNVTGYNVTNTYTEAPKGTITMNWDTQSTTESPIPVDVVFVLDTSLSMVDKNSSRGQNMVNAVNNAIDEILRFNKNNRISVVGYSEYGVLSNLSVSYNNKEHSSVLLPLGRYTANDGKNYLNKSENRIETNIKGEAKTRYFEAGTFTQAGIQKGAEQLINSTGKTVKVDGKDVQRVPVIIIVSDGEPTVFSTNYTSPLSGPVLGTSQLKNSSAVYGYYTILTANHYKQKVTNAYKTTAKVFTIAMDLTTHYGKTVLNPNNINVGSCKNWTEKDPKNAIEDKEISKKLYKYLNNFNQNISASCSVGFKQDTPGHYINEAKYSNVTVVKNPYSNYSYADKAFANNNMTADDLQRAMIGSITETVSNKKTHNIDENDRKTGKVYLDKIDITKDFELKIAGGKTYTSYKDAENDKLVGFDGEKYYVDLTKLIGKTVTVNYRQK